MEESIEKRVYLYTVIKDIQIALFIKYLTATKFIN